ncbi:hypothetical protein [uncultured Photobacterium sp.]|uniref:hypothetical protein n=1 Tax=uncultured Photobacterium sp. TaxID=173973 RepID=UPI002639E927|nr:hypothetical protein [uncultured Photobacterium sp.]
MNKVVYLLSVLALVGCNEDDLTDLVQGNTKVFTVTGANVQSKLGAIDPGYYDINSITNGMGSTPDNLPVASKATLENLGIKVEGEGCGKIEITHPLCFEDGNTNSCLPSEINMLGLAVYTIDLDKVKMASDNGFYPTLATDVGGLYVDIKYQEVNCSYLSSL